MSWSKAHRCIVIGAVLLALLPLAARGQGGKGSPYVLYLIGDAGEAGEDYSAPTLRLLQQVAHDDSAGERGLVFLGDNIYESGLHKKDSKLRAHDEVNINAQLEMARSFPGRTWFVPGNHDWDQGSAQGWKAIQREDKYIDAAMGRNTLRPDEGCPGPEVMELGADAVLVMIDSQWWLQSGRRPQGQRDGCEVTDEQDLLNALAAVFKENKNKRIILAAHHPLYSFGAHGGHFPLRDHLFPLTQLNPDLWLPLPVLGSIYPFFRSFIGSSQDLAHERYNAMRAGLEDLLKQYPGSVHVAGHEHALQFLDHDGTHFVVSGAGAKATWLERTKALKYEASERGFARLVIAANGSMRLDFFTVRNGGAPSASFQLEGPRVTPAPVAPVLAKPVLPASITVVPNEALRAGALHRLIFGDLYRDVWTAPIQVPVLDLDTAFGGLRVKGAGGGLQTRSLRLKANNGHEYVMRSIKKYPGLALAPELRGTVAEDIVSDGVAGSHPYAAVVMPDLSDAVKVYHTNARLVLLPDDPALGEYREGFANSLCLLEERTDGDWRGTTMFGGSKELVSSGDLIHALRKGHKDILDDRAMLRARLFDMLIGDWDRHDDQWRWATFERNDTTIYKPVPRDRDQAFFSQDGLLPNIVNRKWAIGKFQSYGPDIRDIDGQNFNARYLDRAYLTGLDWSAWKSIADSMRAELPDALIEHAIHGFPDTTYALMGARIIAGLKGRRDRLESIARRQYLALAKYVNVVGTDDDEFFDVHRLADGRTEVDLYARKNGKKAGKRRFYHRVFDPADTREIRLYGAEGNDEYRISGTADRAIRVRIIGGLEKDRIQDSSRVGGCGRRTIVYESGGLKKGNELQLGPEARLVHSTRAEALDYDRQEYVPDQLMPLVALGFNVDDGFFLGGGLRFTKQGFKVEPYKWRQQLTASYAVRTGAYRVAYRGRLVHAIGRNDIGLNARVLAPDFNFNFFGFGNRTQRPADPDLFQYRIDLVDVEPYVARVMGIHEFRLSGRYWSATQGALSPTIDADHPLAAQRDADYLGGAFAYTLSNLDHPTDPSRGIRLALEADDLRETHEHREVKGVEADLRLYFPLHIVKARTVMALRAAVSRRDGEVDPLLARNLGGQDGMRGLRRGRYSGNSLAVGNLEIRQDLFNSRNRIVPFRLGLLAFADMGRVWSDAIPDEHLWHTATGGGLFISPLNMLTLQATYGVSDDDALVDVRLGFFF